MPHLTRSLTLILALTLSLNATALSLRSEKRPDGTVALLLTNDPAAPTPPKLNGDPAIRTSLVDFFGYATGSYTNDNTMIVQQVLESLDSEISSLETKGTDLFFADENKSTPCL